MNYIKKKINKHKLANRNHDDDDVYDYIPAVPPHPSELAKYQAKDPENLTAEELAELEEKKRRAEEKAREKEEAKKGQEAWKYFSQLDARVGETVTKSRSVIESLKDSTTADELIKQAELELGFAAPEEDEEPTERGAVFTKGAWVAFAEGQREDNSSKETSPTNPSQVIAAVAAASFSGAPLTPQVVVAEETGPSVIEELLDDFGFEGPPDVATTAVPDISHVDLASGEVDDPFDTSYVSVSIVEAKAAAEIISQSVSDSAPSPPTSQSNQETSYSKTPVNVKSLELTSSNNIESGNNTSDTMAESSVANEVTTDNDFDPEIADIYLQQNKKNQMARYGSSASLASISSNPFLNDDYADGYNPGMPSGAVTPYSGTATPKRRGSSNPFEDDSPQDETTKQLADEASAIAALTADFCSAIGDKEENPPEEDPQNAPADQEPQETVKETQPPPPPPPPPLVVEHMASPVADEDETSNRDDNENNKVFPPPPPPSTEPFDPFATIHDDHTEEIETAAPLAGDSKDLTRQGNQDTTVDDDDLPPPSPPPLDEQNTPGNHDNDQYEERPVKIESEQYPDPVDDDLPEPFDPFQQVDEPTTPCLDDMPPIGVSAAKNETASDITHDARDNSNDEESSVTRNEETTATVEAVEADATTTAAINIDETINGDVESDVKKSDFTLPDFTDPDVDPFDTSTFSFEPVADAVEVIDKSKYDEFSARFEGASDNTSKSSQLQANGTDAFSSPLPVRRNAKKKVKNTSDGFDTFDPYAKKDDSSSSDDDDDDTEKFKIVIRAKMTDKVSSSLNTPVPLLPPPPKTPTKEVRKRGELDEFDSFLYRKNKVKSNTTSGISFNAAGDVAAANATVDEVTTKSSSVEVPSSLSDRSDYVAPVPGEMKRADSTESPSTPLYDEDISQPLEEFPAKYTGDGWEMFIRYPAKKKFTGNRFWKKIFIRVTENNVIQLFNKREDADPFQELPLQASYSMSEISAQQFDQFGKIFTIKLQYVFYRERVGVRKGQIAKVIQGQITSFGSIAKLGMPLDHAPQVSELIKLGTHEYNDIQSLVQVIEEALFKMPLHRDRALSYKTEEIQITVQDDYYVEQNRQGTILKQLARVQVFFLAFLNGMPGVEIGLNDLTRQGKEVVGRHDIIPVVTEEWIRLENYQFHSCVMVDEFEKTRTIKLIPPDACYFELMRFRVRPPKNRELPLQVTCNMYVTKRKVELRCEVLVPGAISRKHGQIPCEDISIRIHVPECWIYFFRTEKHMRYGSVKSAARRPGKIKGLERFLGAAQNLETNLIEASAGVAKYEHVFHSLVWRIPRLPKEGQGAYTQQLLTVNLPLGSFDQIPEKLYEFVHVEFTMPSTTVSHAVVRSVSVTCEEPPEKFVRNVSKHEYKVEMGIHFDYEEENAFLSAAAVPSRPKPPASPSASPSPTAKQVVQEEHSSDSE